MSSQMSTANNRFLLYLFKQSFSHSAKQSYQTILRKRCASSPLSLYIYNGTKIKQDDHGSKYPSIFPGSSILLFSQSLYHRIRDRQRAGKNIRIRIFRHSRLFRSAISMDGRFIPTSFEPASSRGKIQFFLVHAYLSSRWGLPYRYLYGRTCRCTVYLHRLFPPRFTVNRFDRSFDPIFEFISLHVRLKCVTCIPAATNGWTLLSEYQCIVLNVYIYIYIVDIFQNLYRIQLINKSSLNISRDESASPRLNLQNNFHINHPDS